MGWLTNLGIGIGEGAKIAAPFVRNMQEAEIQAERDKRMAELEEMRARREHAFQFERDDRQAKRQEDATVRGEERGIANIPRRQKAELPGLIERKRQEADIEIETANRKPQTVAEGTTLLREGKEPFSVPKTSAPKSPEELAEIGARTGLLKAQEEYWRGAKTNEANARAEAKNAGKEPKPIFPKLTKGDEQGSYWIDQNTNAIGTVVPATPDKPEEKNWIFPNKPGVKGKPTHMVWNFGGRTMSDSEYNRKFYGNVNPVSGNMEDNAAPGERPPLSAFDRSKQPTTQPATPSASRVPGGIVSQRIATAVPPPPPKDFVMPSRFGNKPQPNPAYAEWERLYKDKWEEQQETAGQIAEAQRQRIRDRFR